MHCVYRGLWDAVGRARAPRARRASAEGAEEAERRRRGYRGAEAVERRRREERGAEEALNTKGCAPDGAPKV